MSTEAPGGTSNLDLLRWIGWAQQKAAEDWIRARELTHQQAFVLGFLVRSPGAMQRDLVEASRTSAANVSGVLRILERRGLVERRAEAGDDRVRRVHATATGRDLIAGFDTAVADIERTVLAPLDESERAALHVLLTKVTAELPRPSR